MGIFGWVQDKRDAAQGWIEKGHQAENLEEKYICYAKATELDPGYECAWNAKGWSLDAFGEYKEAINAFDKAIEINPEYKEAWNNRGWALNGLGKFEEAIKAFDRAIGIDPTFEVAWDNKGVSLFYLDRHEEAIKAFDKAIEIDPEYARAWSGKGISLANLKKHEEAIKAFDKTIEIDPKHQFAWHDKGMSLFYLARHEEAIKAFDKAIEIDPKYQLAWCDKGMPLTKLGKHEEALKAFDKAIEIDPKCARAWNKKGEFLACLGNHEKAVKAFDEAAKTLRSFIDPECISAWNNKGMSLAKLGKHEEAIRVFNIIIGELKCWNVAAIDPKIRIPLTENGWSLYELGRYEKAIKAFDRAIEIDPKDARTWSGKGMSLANLGKHEEAIKAFDKAIEIDPDDSKTWSSKGVSLANLGKHEDAIRAFDKAIKAISPFFDSDVPEMVYIWNNKGISLAKIGKHGEAIQAYNWAIKHDPKYAPPWFEKGNVLTNLGRYEEALTLYRRATAAFPSDAALKDAEEKTRALVFRSLFKLIFSFTHTGLEYDTWQVCTLTIANTGTKQLNCITFSFSGEIEVRGLRPFPLSPSEQKTYECSLKAMARGTVPIEVTVTAEDNAGERCATTYDYLIPVSDPQRPVITSPVFPANEKQIFSSEMFPLERTIYDPVAQDFLVSSERPLVNVRKWIEERDPGSYWCVICIHNNSDSPLDEWGIELSATSSLQVVDACIEGYGESATVRESHPMPWLSQWVIGVSHHAGIVIPRSGSRRIYVKLGSNACGVSHTIKGRFMTSHGVVVPIREKTFTHSCDVATLRTALSSDPTTAEKYAENIIRREYDQDTALKLLRSFKQVQEIDQCCTLQNYDEILNRMQLLAGTLEDIQAGDKLTRLVKQNYDALTILGDSEASAERAQRLCSNIIDVWINEFICMEDPEEHSFKSKSRERGKGTGKCPVCGSRLVWRRAQKNNELYRGCTNFDGGCRWNDRSY